MSVQLLFVLFIVGALKGDIDEQLQDKFTECTNILNFLFKFAEGLPDFRRLENEVGESFDTCLAVVNNVHSFITDYGDGEIDPWKDPIILNVGGTNFSTTLATLRSVNGTFFEKMFRQGSMTTPSADGTFFIDRNPKAFGYIMDFLRTGDMLLEKGDSNLRSRILKDAEFFELPEELKEYLKFSSLAGIGLSFSEVSWLNNQLPDLKLGGLLFDTSIDGDHASTFHDRCNGEGPTVTIVETTLGVMFGGYTDESWASSNWATDTDAFVFRLRPSPEKFVVSVASNAIYRHSSYGPWFGNTAFKIWNHCKSNADSFVGSASYHGLGPTDLNNGHDDFRVKQYVVVQAV